MLLPSINGPSSRLCDGPASFSGRIPSFSSTLPSHGYGQDQKGIWKAAELDIMGGNVSTRSGNVSARSQARSVVVAAVAEVDAPMKRATRVPSLPFVKVAGQEEMKLALLLNVVDPGIGGVLIMGDRGTGKSICVSCHYLCLTQCSINQHWLTRYKDDWRPGKIICVTCQSSLKQTQSHWTNRLQPASSSSTVYIQVHELDISQMVRVDGAVHCHSAMNG